VSPRCFSGEGGRWGLKCKLKTHVSGELAYFLKTNFRFGIAVFGGTLHGKILENLLILVAHYGVK
jgi:hypothetical protein